MNWDAIGAIGEIVGAAAVVISLLYLAIQIKTQNIESKLAATHEILEGFRTIVTTFQSAEGGALMVKAMNDYDGLDETERFRIFAMYLPWFRLWEEAYHQYIDGRFDEEMWNSFTKQFSDVMSLRPSQQVWEFRKHMFSEPFRKYVASAEIGEFRNE